MDYTTGGDMAGGVSVVRSRLDDKPWGGRRLEQYGLRLPPGKMIGEAVVTAGDAQITAGAGEGRTLLDIVSGDPAGTLGVIGRQVVGARIAFPLLVKLIDAQANLSIQVHPNDTQAQSRDSLGKTEAWHILAAEPGSSIYAGLRDGVSMNEFQNAARKLDGSSAALLRRIPATAGATILIPAGTVHALGAGVMVYEIQQPSDLTYRMDDWGRVDADGNAREMHLEDGFAVMRPETRPEWIAPIAIGAIEGRRHLLVVSRLFALERVALPGGGRCALPACSSPQVISVLEGTAQAGGLGLGTGGSAVVWPDGDPVWLEATTPTVALRGWVPDLAADLRELNRHAGVDDATLATLSGPLGDVREALKQPGRD
jgi:mannose-6-phosphate isomerase